MKALSYISPLSRTRGGIGFNSDDRTSSRLEEMGCTVGETTLPGELRPYSKRLGKGQVFDFYQVIEPCACCGEEHPVNVVMLCAKCARETIREATPSQSESIRHHVERHVANFRRSMNLALA